MIKIKLLYNMCNLIFLFRNLQRKINDFQHELRDFP